MIAQALRETLLKVSDLLADAREPWWIIGSTAAALHGATPITVRDVDVLLAEADAARLPSAGIAIGPGVEHNNFRSALFGAWTDNPLPVEFMAGFHHRDPDGWSLVLPATRQAIAIGDARVHIPDRAELKAMFLRFGRPKDLERARLL